MYTTILTSVVSTIFFYYYWGVNEASITTTLFFVPFFIMVAMIPGFIISGLLGSILTKTETKTESLELISVRPINRYDYWMTQVEWVENKEVKVSTINTSYHYVKNGTPEGKILIGNPILKITRKVIVKLPPKRWLNSWVEENEFYEIFLPEGSQTYGYFYSSIKT